MGTFIKQMFSWFILSYQNEKPSTILVTVSPEGNRDFKSRIFNCPVGKETSGVVSVITKTSTFPIIWLVNKSDMTKTSTFPIIWLVNKSNLFLIELMFYWAIMIVKIFLSFSQKYFVNLFISNASRCWIHTL